MQIRLFYKFSGTKYVYMTWIKPKSWHQSIDISDLIIISLKLSVAEITYLIQRQRQKFMIIDKFMMIIL